MGVDFFLLFLDQALKVWVKTSMDVGDEIIITDWFILHFVENNGFAFGWEFFGSAGKLFLTIFRFTIHEVILYRGKNENIMCTL